jgi:flavin-dependent dehydrogenase
VGGGPSGATAAEDLARAGRKVALIDRAGRIKPCGGAIPPRLIADFDIPDEMLVAKIDTARMISPTGRKVDIPIENGFVGMVDREHFDEFLRVRAAKAGAHRHTGTFKAIERDETGKTQRRLPRQGDGRGRAPDGEIRDRRRRRALQRRAAGGAGRRHASPTSSPITRSSTPGRQAALHQRRRSRIAAT